MFDSDFEQLSTLAQDPNGLILPIRYYGTGHSSISPDGNHLTVYKPGDEGGRLYLYSFKGAAPILLTEDSLLQEFDGINLFDGFSSDGKFYAFTTYTVNKDGYETHVIDTDGNEVFYQADAAFVDFVGGDEQVIVMTGDLSTEKVDAIRLINFNSGNKVSLTPLGFKASIFSILSTFLSPDQQYIYYFSGPELLKTALGGSLSKTVYTSNNEDAEIRFAFFSQEIQKIIIMEDMGDSFDVFLLDENDPKPILLDSISLEYWGYLFALNQTLLSFSPDGRHLVYPVEREEERFVYVSDINGRGRVRLTQNRSIGYAFSPDARHIGYIELNQSTPEDLAENYLYVSDSDGHNRVQIDSNVSSFLFSPDGHEVIYFKIEDFGNDQYQSELYRVRSDGTKREYLMGPMEGAYFFLKP